MEGWRRERTQGGGVAAVSWTSETHGSRCRMSGRGVLLLARWLLLLSNPWFNYTSQPGPAGRADCSEIVLLG